MEEEQKVDYWAMIVLFIYLVAAAIGGYTVRVMHENTWDDSLEQCQQALNKQKFDRVMGNYSFVESWPELTENTKRNQT